MWKNEVMPPFINRLEMHSDEIVSATTDLSQQVSFFGSSLYSLQRPAKAAIGYLEWIDIEEAMQAG